MSWWDNLNGDFSNRMQAFVAASGGRLSVVSAYRSVETQQQLWDEAIAKYGVENASMWVAPPGRSNHNHGMAIDLGFATEDAQQWAHDNAARFGLEFPMDWEPWHIEPAGLRDGLFGDVSHDAYTVPPMGYLSTTDPNRRANPAFAFGVINSMLMGPSSQFGPIQSQFGPIQSNPYIDGSSDSSVERQKFEIAKATGASPKHSMVQGGGPNGVA